MNDSDLIQIEATNTANNMIRASRKHGICFHNALHNFTCDDCKRVFSGYEELDSVRTDLKAEWC